VISETFESVGSAHIHDPARNISIWGIGRWAVDEPKGHAIEHWEYDEHQHHHNIHVLERYDLGKIYRITRQQHHHNCTAHNVKPPMPPVWTWIKEANYIGKHHIGDVIYDQWQWKNAGVTLTVSVHEQHPNRPYYFSRHHGRDRFEIHYVTFETRTPNDTWFHVPDACKNATISIADLKAMKPVPQVMIGRLGGVCSAAVEFAVEAAKTAAPYIFGDIGTIGYDNDGLIAASFAKAGVMVPRNIDDLQVGGSACQAGVRPGDVLFVGQPATHVALAVGNNLIAECPLTGENCRIAPLDVSVYNGGCRRYC